MKLSRRTVLRGVGVTMALPWLESLNAIASTPAPFPKRLAVLFMGNGIHGYHETNFSMAYSSHISWQTAGSPAPSEVYPSLAFDSLFENRGSLRSQSILDRVKDRAENLSRAVSSTDRARLDEYLTSAREIE